MSAWKRFLHNPVDEIAYQVMNLMLWPLDQLHRFCTCKIDWPETVDAFSFVEVDDSPGRESSDITGDCRCE